jgi:hypothetical protein
MPEYLHLSLLRHSLSSPAFRLHKPAVPLQVVQRLVSAGLAALTLFSTHPPIQCTENACSYNYINLFVFMARSVIRSSTTFLVLLYVLFSNAVFRKQTSATALFEIQKNLDVLRCPILLDSWTSLFYLKVLRVSPIVLLIRVILIRTECGALVE